MPDLLLELLCEEIPARMQPKAAQDLRRLVTDGLVERGLTYGAATAFATPRRLALAVTGLTDRSPELREERKGPRVDAPEAAIAGFLRATGLAREDLEIRDEKKAQVFFAVTTRPGRAAAAIVAETVEAAVRGFPWPKSMRWGDGSLRWVRPLHSILCLLSDDAGSTVVGLEIDGIRAGDVTRGHRFMAPGAIRVSSVEDYAAKLERGFVLLDPEERAARIRNDATQAAFAMGLELVEDAGLVAENAGLTEWPVTLTARIDPRFLDLPPEVLRTSMKEHQKFLSLRDPASGRITGYVVVANRETADSGATILAGNARVLAARLSDAEFFWRNDLRTPLADMAAKLDAVTFHNKLGTQGARIDRIAALAREIAPAVGADPDLAERAARLAKADLASQMVFEFPELQGIMGRYYAERAGEPAAVAAAAPEHYAPLGPSDAVPTAPVSVAVALADKLDTLTGFWAIDEKPTGSKDPFALRRAALGVIRILLEGFTRLPLRDLLARGVARHQSATIMLQFRSEFEAHKQERKESNNALVRALTNDETGSLPEPSRGGLLRELWEIVKEIPATWSRFRELEQYEDISLGLREASREQQEFARDLLAFLHDRLKVFLRDQGIRHDVIDAATAMPGNDDLVLLVARVRALQAFLATEDGANLLTGYKRAANILEAEEKKDGVEYSLDPDPRFAETDTERALFAALDTAETALGPKLKAEDFAGAMTVLAGLRAPIDAFFDATTVNAESPAVRRNRLCLLNRIRVVMNRVAVFAEIEGA